MIKQLFFGVVGMAKQLQRRIGFDALLAFDVSDRGVGGRMGKRWGSLRHLDYRSHSPVAIEQAGRFVPRNKGSSIVFYQSRECLEIAARFLGNSPDEMTASGRHLVLPRGIDEAPNLPRLQIRKRLRAELGIPDDQILVLSIGKSFVRKGSSSCWRHFHLFLKPPTYRVSWSVRYLRSMKPAL